MGYEFAIHHIPEMHVAAIREQLDAKAFPAFLQGAFPELYAHVGRLGATPIGHPFVIYHAFGPDAIDAEVCAPVAAPLAEAGRIRSRVVPEATIVRTLHVGPYEELGKAYEAIHAWVADHGYVAVGPHHERYLNGPPEVLSPAEYRTEIDLPIAEVPVTEEAPREPLSVG